MQNLSCIGNACFLCVRLSFLASRGTPIGVRSVVWLLGAYMQGDAPKPQISTRVDALVCTQAGTASVVAAF